MKTIKGFLSATLVTGMALCSFMPKTNLIAAELPDKFHDVSETFGTAGTALSDTLFSVGYGTAENEVVFDAIMNAGDGAGPEAFWVENESSVYILDSLGKELKHYIDGDFVGSVPLTSASAPQCFTITSDGTIYVCDTYNGEASLLVYDKSGLHSSFALGNLIDTRNVSVDENGTVQISDWYDIYEYHLSNGALTLFSKTPLETSKMPENAYTRRIGEDTGFHYELQTQLVDSFVFLGEIQVATVNSEGNIMSSARVPLEEFLYQPNQYIQINGNGEIYMMIPTKDDLEIRKITLGAASDSKLDEVIALAAEYEAEAQIKAASADSTNASISLTRQEVLNRANLMASYRWTLSAKNTTVKTNVTLPDFVAKAVSSGELQNGGTIKIMGIPYCWGGFDSQYTSNNKEYATFDAAIAAGYTAGNVFSTKNEGKISNTTGLDCSGFVSAAYGLSYKRGTEALYKEIGRKIDQSELQTMDFLVRWNYPGELNHALLFYQWQSNDKSNMLIIEANNPDDYDDKVVVRIMSTDKLLGKGYIAKTPW